MPLPFAPPGDKRVLVADLETYPNWFCVVLSDGDKTKSFASHRPGEIAKLRDILLNKNLVIAGFNNHAYDDIILRHIVDAMDVDGFADPQMVNALSSRIIDPADDEAENLNFKDRYSATPWAYSIDVFQLLNGKGSLKEHACRSHAPDVGEAPYEFGQPLPPEGFEAVERYCRLDVANTVAKLRQLWPLVSLREKLNDMFGIGDRIYCLSEQGIAQATFLKLHRDRSGQNAAQIREAAQANPDNLAPTWAATDIISPKVQFATDPFRTVFAKVKAAKFVRTDNYGAKWEMRSSLLPINLIVSLAGARFQLGVGGLHSVDEPAIFKADDKTAIIDLDVVSYYPSIIINDQLHPKHLGAGFCTDMRRIRDQRVAAKKAGDKVVADALKIVVNATFGKLNDVWSPLRSVPDAMRVTINGQLYLLMLIERLHAAGAKILSANTDGVTIMWPKARDADLAPVVKAWEKDTGFELERADYAMVARRDVNSYIAKTTAGKVKLKGAFQPDSGKGDGLIIKRAAIEHLTTGRPIREVVESAKPHELIFYQRCKNGGTLHHGNERIGRLARWYASTEGPALRRQNPNGSWATLPHGHGTALVLDLDDIGPDIHTEHYISEAEKLVRSCQP